MQRYRPSLQSWHVTGSRSEYQAVMREDSERGMFLHKDDVLALEQRLYECESAMLLRHDAAIATYIEKYPEPVKAPTL